MVYVEDAVNERTCRKCRNFVLVIFVSMMHHAQDDRSKLMTKSILIENNPRYTTRMIAEIMKISQTIVVEHLHKNRLSILPKKRNELSIHPI